MTANNDIYMQLLATEFIISDFNFSGVGGHPIGLALVASFLRILGMDPLIILYYIQPVFAAVCFVLLFKLLKKILSNELSFLISLCSMSSLILIKAMNQVGAEIFALASILYMMLYVWNVIIINKKVNNTDILVLIGISWITILLRNASLFIVLGILLFIYRMKIFGIFKYLLISLMILLPGILKSILAVDNNSSLKNVLSKETPIIFFDQITKHLMNLTEIILPYNLHINSFPKVKLFIGFFCITFCLFLYFKKNIQNEKNYDKKLMGDYFFTVGMFYYFLLSFATLYLGNTSIFSTDWGNIYRVSGFGILFLLITFWIYIIYFKVLKKKFVLYILTFLCFIKISYGIRYEMIYAPTRLLFNDYRQSAELVRNFMLEKSKNNKLLIYTFGGYQGKNLYYILKYYELFNPLPFKVERLTENNRNEDLITFCAINDLDNFDKNINTFHRVTDLDGIFCINIKNIFYILY